MSLTTLRRLIDAVNGVRLAAARRPVADEKLAAAITEAALLADAVEGADDSEVDGLHSHKLQWSTGLGPTWEHNFSMNSDGEASEQVTRWVVHGHLGAATGHVYLWKRKGTSKSYSLVRKWRVQSEWRLVRAK